MLINYLINLLHDAERLVECDDLLLVAENLFTKGITLPDFEPLVADLIATDVKIPDLLGNTVEADGSRLVGTVALPCAGLTMVELEGAVRPTCLPDLRILWAGMGSDGVVKLCALHDMQYNKIGAKTREGSCLA